MSINPFNDDNGSFFVLVNDEEQHSPWATSATFQLAGGWCTAKRTALHCVDYVEQNWTDIRPKNLRETLAAGRASDN